MAHLEQRLFFARQIEKEKVAKAADTASVSSASSSEDRDDGKAEVGEETKLVQGKDENDFTSVKSRLLWQKAGLSAVSIKQQYDEAKGEYKGRKMSVVRK